MKKLFTKKILIFLCIVFLCIILAFGILFNLLYFNTTDYLVDEDNYIPTIKREKYILKNVEDISIDDYISKNNNTLLVFWASWCQSCVEESEMLNNFINNNPNIPVIVVSFDYNIDDIENYLTTNNYNWFVVFDPSRKVRQRFDEDTKGIPATYLIDKNLNVISKEISSMSEEDFLNFYNSNK